MSTIYYDARLNLPAHQTQSLIEKKKQQWAREREELAGLSENVPWGTRDSLQLYDRPNIKTRYVTKYQKEAEYLRRDSTYSTSSSATVSGTPRRRQHSAASIVGIGSGSQQLPPLYKNQHFTYTPDEKSDKEMGGETSGYGSDNAQHTPEHLPRAGGDPLRQPPNQQSPPFYHQRQVLVAANHGGINANGYESSSSGREDRLKWGDRGVHLGGRYWEPVQGRHAEDVAETPGAPGWVKRGLERDTELVIVNNSSPAESPEQDYGERPGTSSTGVTNNRCFIRGQNVPIDTAELAERERRRQVALAHQEAIREQLEEREKRRQEEHARRLREEYEEERRIIRQQELERQRQLEQERLVFEKQERERKRKEALREAIEIAEKEAKEEKLKQRLMRQNQLNTENSEKTIDKDIKTRKNLNNERQQLIQEKEDTTTEKQDVPQKLNNRKQQQESRTDVENQINSKHTVLVPTKQESIADNADESMQLVLVNREKNTSSDSESSIGVSASLAPSIVNNNVVGQSLTTENLAVLLQNPIAESLQMQNVQFVLIPTLTSLNNTSMVPFTTLATQTNTAQIQLANTSTTRTENRLLTPTQYRNKKTTCDSSTQTDFPDYRKELCEKLANIEICYETSRSRKERRSRSEMRHGELMESQERPKWGVNRPPTRYLKQSEKDPLYQRRKMRQKLRQSKTYDDKRYSSDDSQTGSPRTYRKKRGYWRKDEALYAENIKVYQTEIIPLETDKDHIYFRAKAQPNEKQSSHQCCCRCIGVGTDVPRYPKDGRSNPGNNGVDIMKIETPREYRDKLPLCNNNNSIGDDSVLDKLTSIHNDLMLKDNWDERNILYSPSRNP